MKWLVLVMSWHDLRQMHHYVDIAASRPVENKEKAHLSNGQPD